MANYYGNGRIRLWVIFLEKGDFTARNLYEKFFEGVMMHATLNMSLIAINSGTYSVCPVSELDQECAPLSSM